MNNLLTIKDSENVDVLFCDTFDHNEGKPNHGLFQMFQFFKHSVGKKSIYVNTLESLYENNIDIFNINRFVDSNCTNVFHLTKFNTERHLREEEVKTLSDLLISVLPNHKILAICDLSLFELPVLEKVIDHFKSKLLVISAVNNTWTGFCSYPEEYKCENFKNINGCTSFCPAKSSSTKEQESVRIKYTKIEQFIDNNKFRVFLNLGNKYSHKEANESQLFKKVKKVVIPLKNEFPNDTFEQIWSKKHSQRHLTLMKLKNNKNFNIDKIKFIMMWSAYSLNIKRKGFENFIDIMRIFKEKNALNDLSDILLIVCGRYSNTGYIKEMKKLGLQIAPTGLIDKSIYNVLLSASDAYCNTTISDAGPRTTYESAAMATPIISFDNCNALDFVNEENGSLIQTYDQIGFANAIEKFMNLKQEEKKQKSKNIFSDYKNLMNSKKLANKWKLFLNEIA